ncbi:MAG TPA: LLM class flavin-dependent oxidoreductase [Nonomuraea sp.]|nr:LLM class flavin-dependent oxidoreductase [Nonomuraea sp.]
MTPARFHCAPPSPREAPGLDEHLALCREAERHGIDSVVVGFDLAGPDPFAWAAALGRRAKAVRFLLACRPGVSSPTYWAQQVNTLAAVLGGRVGVLVGAEWEPGQQLAYGDATSREEWYTRLDEFWQVCHGLWEGSEPVRLTGRHYRIDGATINARFVSGDTRHRPEIYVRGPLGPSLAFAGRHADCVLVGPDEPAAVRAVLDAGVRAGLVVPMNGSAGDVAATIGRHRAAGVTDFFVPGERLRTFGEEVLPLVRADERSGASRAAGLVRRGGAGR